MITADRPASRRQAAALLIAGEPYDAAELRQGGYELLRKAC